ncbi:diguanylate cyclase, partial [Escherichia coli]
SYSPSVQNSVNAEEQYRLLTIYDDINVERERQIRSLTDWENQFIYNIATGLPIKDLAFLSKSEFGMWFAHKGKHILGKSVLLSGMETLMKKIDHHLKQELPLHAQLTTDERLKLLQ